ncbi:hypothetical protein ACFQ4K_24390 [Tistrella bauzanensis]
MPAEALRFYLALMSEPQDARELSMADLARTHNLFMVRDLGTSLAAISNLDPVAGTALAQDRPEDDLMLDFRNRLHVALDARSFSLAALAGVVLGVNGQMKQARLYGTPERIPRLAGLFQLFARPLMPTAADGIAAFLGLGQGWGSRGPVSAAKFRHAAPVWCEDRPQASMPSTRQHWWRWNPAWPPPDAQVQPDDPSPLNSPLSRTGCRYRFATPCWRHRSGR